MADKTVLEFEVDSNIKGVAKDMGTLSDNTQEATERNKDLNKSAGVGTIGFKNLRNIVVALGTAFKALGVGLLITAFTSLGNVFRQNQKVLDFFNIAMESLSLAFNDLFTFIDTNIGTITGHLKAIFTDPLGGLYKLGQGIQTFFIDNLGGVIDFLGSLGELIATNPITNPKLFAKNLAAVGLAAQDAKKDIKIVFDEITNSVTNYTKGIIENATATISLRKESELAAVKVQGLIEEYDRQAEKLRQVRDDESKTFEERIEANNKLGEVLKEQEEEMLKLVDIQIASAKADVDKNNNLQNQIKLQEALNEKKAVLAQITGFESEQLVNNIALQREAADSEVQIQKEKEEAKAAIRAANIANIEAGIGLVKSLAGENKEIQAAALIAENAAGIAKTIISTQSANAGALATPQAKLTSGAAAVPVIAANNIAAGISIAASVAATAKGLAALGGGGVSGGGSNLPAGGGSAPQTPAPQMMSGAFDLTGGVAPEPVRAFVVTDEMTSSQNQLANIRRRATI